MKLVRHAAVGAALASGMLSFNANAVNINSNGIGEVAIAPYYTVRNGWATLINLTNTTNQPLLVKVRFHEGHNSRDVLDYTVAMSANDVFVGRLALDANTNLPTFSNTDSLSLETNLPKNGKGTCVIPSLTPGQSVPMSTAAFSGSTIDQTNTLQSDNDGATPAAGTAATTAELNDRLYEGYVEFIVMSTYNVAFGTIGAVREATTGVINVGQAIEAHDCAAVGEALTTNVNTGTGLTRIIETARQGGEGTNALKFNYRLINIDSGVEAGGAATAWSNFFNPAATAANPGTTVAATTGTSVAPAGGAAWAAAVGTNAACTRTRGANRRLANPPVQWLPGLPAVNGSCQNLVTAQIPFDFLEPSLNDAWPPVARILDDATNTLRTIRPGVNQAAATAQGAFNANLRTVNTAALTGFAGNTARGVDAMALTLQSSGVINEWTVASNSATDSTRGDWVVTFPTKSFSVDRGLGRQFAVVTQDRPESDLGGPVFPAGSLTGRGFTNTVAYPPFQSAYAQPITATTGVNQVACTAVSVQIFDCAERLISNTGPVFSPAPVLQQRLCYEANIISFAADAANSVAAPNSIFGSKLNIQTDQGTPSAINVAPLAPNANGWMRLNTTRLASSTIVSEELNAADGFLANTTNATVGGNAQVAGRRNVDGLPITGFYVKFRNRGSADRNFASSLPHAYERIIR